MRLMWSWNVDQSDDGDGKEIVMTFDREIKMELDKEDMEWIEKY